MPIHPPDPHKPRRHGAQDVPAEELDVNPEVIEQGIGEDVGGTDVDIQSATPADEATDAGLIGTPGAVLNRKGTAGTPGLEGPLEPNTGAKPSTPGLSGNPEGH